MCTNIKRIYNRYVHRDVYVKCGKCEACLQEKANRRTQRIRNNSTLGYIPLFVTLTYDRLSCPIVYREDLSRRNKTVNVYRLVRSYNARVDADYTIVRKRKYVHEKIGELKNLVYSDDFDAATLPSLKKLSQKFVGIAFYKDCQDFFKRLKEYVKNHSTGLPPKYSWFCTSEYGETTYRPHFHILLYVPTDKQQFFRKAVLACWPYADYRRTDQYIEVARNAASYVSAYVNCGADFPIFFQNRATRPHSSMSRHFGVDNECFSLANILASADRRDMVYNITKSQGGILQVSAVAIPQYAIRRYFPLFKGYSRCSNAEVDVCLRHPESIGEFFERYKYDYPELSYSSMDVHRFSVRVRHAFEDYCEQRGLDFSSSKSLDIYVADHIKVWNAYRSTIFRNFYQEVNVKDSYECYDNFIDLHFGIVRSPTLSDDVDGRLSPLHRTRSFDVNQFDRNIESTADLTSLFYKKMKTRKVINYSMSELGHYV